MRCAGSGGSGPGVLHMTRAVCWVGGRGVVRALCWMGGGKWAPRVAHDTCSLLGGEEGPGALGGGGVH